MYVLTNWIPCSLGLVKMHLATLLFRFRCSWPRRLHLVYHMCISWQWPAWALWIMTLPFLIYTGHWFGSFGVAAAVSVYVLPTAVWAVVATAMASLETKHTYDGGTTPAIFRERFGRIVPYLVINTGMLPHQFSSFAEGLFGSLHGEFERTPKAASVTTVSDPGPPSQHAKRAYAVRVHWPYVLTEAFFVGSQLGWAALFAANGFVLCAIGAAYVASCVGYLGFFYGDHLGKVCFVIDRSRLGLSAARDEWRARAAVTS